MAQRSLQATKLTAGVSDDVSYRNTTGEFETASGDGYEELVAQVRSLSQQLGKLRADRDKTRANKRGACWNCGKPGHFRRNCHKDVHLRVKRRKGQLSLRLYLDSARGGGGLNNTYVS